MLQAYGLMLAYFFAFAAGHLASTKSLYDLPGNLFEVGAGLIFLAVFMYGQGKLLRDLTTYLLNARDIHGWIRDATSLQGMLRCILTLGICAFYLALLRGKITFDLPKITLFKLLGYQAVHPIASLWVARTHMRARYRTEMKHVPAWYQVVGIVMGIFSGGVFCWFSVLLKAEHVPAYWLPLMMGTSFIVFGLTTFLLEDIKGRTREVIVDDGEQ
ncbi:MAG: hypothetical protein GXP31_01550 [Kiritimatiellaeota bacterium]|nr:hypothetical protein [Kiritimatiellota bacterium]